MFEFLELLFSTEGFSSRWSSGQWTTFHGFFDQFTNLVIVTCFMAIPVAMAYVKRQRQNDVPLPELFSRFGTFVFWAGLSHVVGIVSFYWPAYRLFTVMKIATMFVAVRFVLYVLPRLGEYLKMMGPMAYQQRLSDLTLVERQLRHRNNGLRQQIQSATDLATMLRTMQELQTAGTQEEVKHALDRLGVVTGQLRKDIENFDALSPLATAPLPLEEPTPPESASA